MFSSPHLAGGGGVCIYFVYLPTTIVSRFATVVNGHFVIIRIFLQKADALCKSTY